MPVDFYRKIASFFQPSIKVLPLTEAEKSLLRQQLREEMGQFIYEEDGFRYPFKEHDDKLKWSSVERIVAYKLDLVATDEICLDILSDGWKITYTESLAGWYVLLAKLKEAFPAIPDNWYVQVMHSPFATNYTVLYEREDRRMPESTNFYASLKIKSPEIVVAIFQGMSWAIRNSGWTEWEMSNTWSELHLEQGGEGLLLNGLVAFHPHNIASLDELLDRIGVAYQYEYYDNQGQLLLERKYS